jgi:hypothetical protein
VEFLFHKTCQLIYNQQYWDTPGWLEDILLAGAVFELVRFNGPGRPPDDVIVTEDMIGPGDGNWTRVGNTQTSTGDINAPIVFGLTIGSYYHLIETVAPDGFQPPHGQWRIVAVERTVNGVTEVGFRILAIGDSTIPAFVNILGEDCYGFCDEYNATFGGRFFVGNRPIFDIPNLGGVGSRVFLIIGTLLLSALMGGTLYSMRQRRRVYFKK